MPAQPARGHQQRQETHLADARSSDTETELRVPLHRHTQRRSYADTDPAGILYYATWFPRRADRMAVPVQPAAGYAAGAVRLVDSFPGLSEYIRWYNKERISTKLEGLSPVQYRAQALAA